MKPPRKVEPSLPDKVIAINECFRAAKIPHAIGGALALAYYAEPRTTIDIDINVFVPVESWPDVAEALASIGVDTSRLDREALARDGQCRLWWGDNAVDIFFAYDAIHQEMRKEVRRVPFADTTLPILSPEHLAVCKAMFDRAKDWIDIEQMSVATEHLDLDQVERSLGQMAGKDDPRLKRLRELRATLSHED